MVLLGHRPWGVAGNDPYHRFNVGISGADVTNTDYIDPLSSDLQLHHQRQRKLTPLAVPHLFRNCQRINYVKYRIRSTGEVKTQGQIRSDHPNTSLPKVWTEATCDSLGIDPVIPSPQPTPSADYKVVVRDGVEQDANSNWVYAWTEQDMFTSTQKKLLTKMM